MVKRKRMTARFEDGVVRRRVGYYQVSRMPDLSLGSPVYVGREKGEVIKDMRPRFDRATIQCESGEKRRKVDSVLISLAVPDVGHMKEKWGGSTGRAADCVCLESLFEALFSWQR